MNSVGCLIVGNFTLVSQKYNKRMTGQVIWLEKLALFGTMLVVSEKYVLTFSYIDSD